MIEGVSKRGNQWRGRTDQNRTVVFDMEGGANEKEVMHVKKGDYVVVKIGANLSGGTTLIGDFVKRITLQEWGEGESSTRGS